MAGVGAELEAPVKLRRSRKIVLLHGRLCQMPKGRLLGTERDVHTQVGDLEGLHEGGGF